jgi:hypothetical protein
MALPTKPQMPPRCVNFLQEMVDHSWDVHAVRSDEGAVRVKRG